MDPLIALGLAANVFACISFASDLIKGTIDISTSPNGCSANVSKLDSVYADLERLSTGLEQGAQLQISDKDKKDPIRGITIAVERLSDHCKRDCSELLQILSKLKTKNAAGGKWKSFRVAVRTVWENKRMEELEERLSKTQQTLILHICALANFSHEAHSRQLEELQQQSIQLQSDQARSFENITNRLKELKASPPLQLYDLQTSLQLLESNSPLDKYRRTFDTKDIEDLQKGFQSLSFSEKDVIREQSIIKSLAFDSRSMRHEQIAEAHSKTIRWALSTDPNDNRGAGLGNWLESGSGIFWVSGKPGSGKSTLMKLLADSPISYKLIKNWAHPRNALLASHYFWIAGTPMQKSYQGLLQTLLYDIFRQCTALIREVCSDNRWAKSGHDSKWSLLELGNILRKISGTNSVIRKFCFFIDGVDEFEGDHEAQTELCRTFKELASSGHIKLVLSSRPWNIFEEQFGLAFPKLYMQDLTREDIQVYTQSSLEEHSRWADLSSNDSQGQLLVSEITERSEGVFLWVRLVTKLLKTGLTNRDKLSDLHRRLRSFPTELEPFFKTMLESVEPFYHNHMSTTLQIALQSGDGPLGFLAYHFHNTEYEDANYAATLPVGLMEARDLEEIKSDISWHLDCRTRGLLEINPRSGIVNFLHRTARDFLETQEMHDFLTAKLDASMDFNPVLSLFKIKVALIKVSPVPNQIERVSFAEYRAIGDSQSNLLNLMRNAMDLAQKLELDAVYEACLRSHLSELDRGFECLCTYWK